MMLAGCGGTETVDAGPQDTGQIRDAAPSQDASPTLDAEPVDAPSGDAAPNDGATPDAGPSESGALTVLVIEAGPGGRLLPGAEVSWAGVTKTATTPPAKVVFHDVAAGRGRVKVSAAGHAPAVVPYSMPAGGAKTVIARLWALGEPVIFDVAEGLDLFRDGVYAAIPASGVVDAAGRAVTGTVALTIVTVDPRDSSTHGAFPGPLVGRSATTTARLESFVMFELTLWRGETKLQLAPGMPARIGLRLRPDLRDRFPVGSSVPHWTLDLDQGVWVADGQGTIHADAGGARWWVFEAPHFSWGNMDSTPEEDSIRCSTVTLLEATTHQPLTGRDLLLDSAEYGSYDEVTDGQGRACMEQGPGPASLAHYVDSGGRWPYYVFLSIPDDHQPRRCSSGTCPAIVAEALPAVCISGHIRNSRGGFVYVRGDWRLPDGSGGRSAVEVEPGSDQYCLKVAPGSHVRVQAERVALGYDSTPVVEVDVGSATACGPGCTTADLEFQDGCSIIDVQDAQTLMPVADATVQASWQDLDGAHQQTALTAADGRACLDLPVLTPISVRASKEVNGRRYRAEPQTTSLQPTNPEPMCGGVLCQQGVRLSLSGPTCAQVTVLAQGTPVPGVTIEGDAVTRDGAEPIRAYTGANGAACVELPLNAETSLYAHQADPRDPSGPPLAGAASTFTAPGVSANCGSTCPVSLGIEVDYLRCVEGTVRIGSTPVAGATVQGSVQHSGVATAVASQTTGPDGHYCFPVFFGSSVTLLSSITTGTVAHQGIASVPVISTGSAVCGSGAGCAQQDIALLSGRTTGCVSGRVILPDEYPGHPATPLAAGTVINLFDATPAVTCSQPGMSQPSDWGNIIEHTTIGSNGTFCLSVPLGVPNAQMVVGDCNLATQIDIRCLNPPPITLPTAPGTCGVGCTPLGDVVLNHCSLP